MRSSRPSALRGWFLAWIFLALVPGTAVPADPPNVVVILADDFGADAVGAYGGQSYLTPNLDQLAAGGARFTRAYAQPLCTPTRAQLMTGKSNVRNYVSFGRLPKGQRTFGNAFREAGYRTFMAGKWQLSDAVPGSFQDPIDFGFEEYYLWQLDRRPQRYFAPGFEAHIPSAGWFGQRLDYPASAATFGPDLMIGQIESFLERNAAQPFLLYYSMLLTHDPFVPAPGHPDYQPTAAVEPNSPVYFKGMVEYADGLVGRLLAKLDALGLTQNTLVIFLGDNGSPLEVASVVNGVRQPGGKGYPTNAGTRVPFLARWPARIPAGTVVSTPVDSTDVFPSLVEAAGLAAPEDTDGISFLPAALGISGPVRGHTYCWSNPLSGNVTVDFLHEFACDGRYKRYRTGVFVDTEADPGETAPLDPETLAPAAAAAHAALGAALAARDADVADRTRPPRVVGPAWAMPPTLQNAGTSLTMVAAAAEDRNGPVLYQFRNRTTGAQGEWQDSRTHTVTGPGWSPSDTFLYRVRDVLGNTSAWQGSVPEGNVLAVVAEQGGQNGATGLQNLGQSFTVPAELDGWILDEFELHGVNHPASRGTFHLAIYDGFTNRTQRGSLLALSTQPVTLAPVEGAPLAWSFGNLALRGGTVYYGAVCAPSGQPLPAGQGLLAQHSTLNPYPGGAKLNETGAVVGSDLRFSVSAHRHPRTFAEWELLHPESSGFAATEPGQAHPNGIRYFHGLDLDPLARQPRAEGLGYRFGIAPGVSDVTWRIRASDSLFRPAGLWEILPPESPLVQFDAGTRDVRVTPPAFDGSLFLRLELQGPAD